MTDKELNLAADLLDLAREKFSNHSCNDFDFPNSWTDEDKASFIKGYHEWNGDPEEFDPEHLEIADFVAMSYLAELLRRDYGNG